MNQHTIDIAVKTLKRGGVVVFPTDTVWGIGTLASNQSAIHKLYQIKKRPLNQPTAILVSNLKQAQQYAIWNPLAQDLTDQYWPGGLTLILPTKKDLPSIIQGENQSIGVRMPDHPLTLEIIDRGGEPIVTSSANIAGDNPPQKRGELRPEIIRKIDYLCETGESGQQKPSSIIDLTHPTPNIVRHGTIDLNLWLQKHKQQ